MYKIEKNIKISSKPSKARVYPWSEMEINDSFLVKKSEKTKHLYSSISGSFYTWRKKTSNSNAKIVIRTVDAGLRVWLVA